ncbi:hypothetical protein B0O80DRAFT_2766 [Mortierella sp. GBAus27b]|nr:hypothetical protein BGX31_010958 [Mortierella sp. GBA43]KAI8362950.1 hypothetical protein B0O80DRAFT_2766 [Mortierella sp. GBAus27b]
MATNDAEQTPLLHDQDDHHDNADQNGNHLTPASSPKKIHKILPKLFNLINSLVDSASVEDDVVSDDVVAFMASIGKEVVYGLLRCVETYTEAGSHDVGRKALLDRRAAIAQIAAAAVTKVFVEKDLMGTYCHVLTHPYYISGENHNTAENAIEIAIRVHATDFLANIEVQRCIQALWNGLILQTEDEQYRVRFVEYSGARRSRRNLWEWVDVGRLNVPRYQNNIKIAMFIIFLIMYSIVVNNRTDMPTFVEWGLYVFVCGYIFEEFRLIFEGGTAFFLGSIWHWINILSYCMFLVSFSFRFTACFLATDENTVTRYNEVAYDILALLAVFLWIKTLSLLDGIQYFGTMVMVLQKMLKDGIMFFWLLTWVYIGCLQSFYALQPDEEKDFNTSSMLLIRGFLQDPDWDLANNIDKTYGNWIFGLYLFLTSIILLNLLVALFNSSYTNITDSAEKEYLALFSFKVFSYLKSPDQFPYTAPFNLIEVFLIIPWTVVLSKKMYAKLNRAVMGFLFWIPVLIIARSERRRYWKLKTTDEENRMDNGRRLYFFLTVDDNNVDDLFLKATQEHVDDDDDDDIQTGARADQAATVNQEEEGILAAGSPDLWLSSMSPLESLEEFKVRRAQEKEAKDTKRQSMANRGSEDAVASGSGSQEQLSGDVVQSLLATLAKLEARQKDMEELLKTFVGESKEDRALAQARG